MNSVVITGTGVFTPPYAISNEELVAAFNQFVQQDNLQHAQEIASGLRSARQESNAEFIVKASGIKNRYMMTRAGVLDPAILQPLLPERSNQEISLQAEISVAAAKQAMAAAQVEAHEIDMVLVACSNLQRPYPAVAIEVQAALGANGYGFDLNVACSSATFGIQTAANAIANGNAKRVLMVNPEICSAHLNFRDRDSHFIFGDACSAVILEQADSYRTNTAFEVVNSRLVTQFSNNIRNNFGFLNRTHPESQNQSDKLFQQQGRQVFKEVVPMVVAVISSHLDANQLTAQQINRFWLHQANLNMNRLIAERLLHREATFKEAPVILDEYANTSSAGSVIAFHKYHQDMQPGELGILCSFGAGYSIGSVLLRKLSKRVM